MACLKHHLRIPAVTGDCYSEWRHPTQLCAARCDASDLFLADTTPLACEYLTHAFLLDDGRFALIFLNSFSIYSTDDGVQSTQQVPEGIRDASYSGNIILLTTHTSMLLLFELRDKPERVCAISLSIPTEGPRSNVRGLRDPASKSDDPNDPLLQLINARQAKLLSATGSSARQEVATISIVSSALSKHFAYIGTNTHLGVYAVESLLAFRSRSGNLTLPEPVYTCDYQTNIIQIRVIQEGPTSVVTLVGLEDQCLYLTINPKLPTKPVNVSSPGGTGPGAGLQFTSGYLTAAASSPFLPDYWLVGSNIGVIYALTRRGNSLVTCKQLSPTAILEISFSPTLPDVFLVVTRQRLYLCRFISTICILAQFSSGTATGLVNGGFIQRQGVHFWNICDNGTFTRFSLGSKAMEWYSGMVTSFARQNPMLNAIYDRIPEEGDAILQDHLYICASIYARDLERAFTYTFSRFDALDSSSLSVTQKSEILRYLFELLKPAHNYLMGRTTMSMIQASTLARTLQNLCTFIPPSLPQERCLLPTENVQLQFTAYDLRFTLEGMCQRWLDAPEASRQTLRKQLERVLMEEVVKVLENVKSQPVATRVLMRCVMEILAYLSREKTEFTPYLILGQLSNIIEQNHYSLHIFAWPLLPSAVCLWGTIPLKPFFQAVVSSTKKSLLALSDEKTIRVDWAVEPIKALTTITVADVSGLVISEAASNAMGQPSATLVDFLRRLSSNRSNREVASLLNQVYKREDTIIQAMKRDDPSSKALSIVTDKYGVASQLALITSLYAASDTEDIIQYADTLTSAGLALLEAYNLELVKLAQESDVPLSPSASRTVTLGTPNYAAPKLDDAILGAFLDEHGMAPIHSHNSVFTPIVAPLPMLGAVYGLILVVFWPRAICHINSELEARSPAFSKLIGQLEHLLTNQMLVYNLSPNELIHPFLTPEASSIFEYQRVQMGLYHSITHLAKLYLEDFHASLASRGGSAELMAEKRENVACLGRIGQFLASARVTKLAESLDKFRADIATALS
ncbi:hypothetical protein GMRT_11446 [Giardia muris]|uniref:Uncharacterized protein n=1 Tax=Giardia muris TaxID=5742 RepID=A0A4Z1SVV1_GIAMU|nr:hypothetical protein GMRT_11446 [Giardia muris]|eukprot:TNJ29750.1 hypothetical protein GMRT_11446 [Giardia muris]